MSTSEILGGGHPGADLPVLTAVTDPSLEAELVAAFGAGELGVTVVRRCVDLVELLAAASVRSARAALVSADLRGLDRAAISQLAGYGVVTVGLARDEAGERLVHQLGAAGAVPVTASAPQVAGALHAAAQLPAAAPDAAEPRQGTFTAPTAAAVPSGGAMPGSPSGRPADAGSGVVIAVWGPTGAPGRSTLALGLADALARRAPGATPDAGLDVLLVDADPYGGVLAQMTGVLDEAPGLAAACRAGNAGTLDAARLAACCRELVPGLRVLTGLDDASRWPELRPPALQLVLQLARRASEVTVVDCGFGLDDPAGLPDGAPVRRNAATLTCLREADRVLVVTSAEPVALTRLVRELPRLADALHMPLDELLDGDRLMFVANRVRPGLAPGDAERGIAQALDRHAGVRLVTGLPLDQRSVDASYGHGRLLSEAAPDSELATALAGLARELTRWFAPDRLPSPSPAGPGRRRRRRRHRLPSSTPS